MRVAQRHSIFLYRRSSLCNYHIFQSWNFDFYDFNIKMSFWYKIKNVIYFLFSNVILCFYYVIIHSLSYQLKHSCQTEAKKVKLYQLINLQNKNSESQRVLVSKFEKWKVNIRKVGLSSYKSNPLEYKSPQHLKTKPICLMHPLQTLAKDKIRNFRV